MGERRDGIGKENMKKKEDENGKKMWEGDNDKKKEKEEKMIKSL
jgi:hypothetical protein